MRKGDAEWRHRLNNSWEWDAMGKGEGRMHFDSRKMDNREPTPVSGQVLRTQSERFVQAH